MANFGTVRAPRTVVRFITLLILLALLGAACSDSGKNAGGLTTALPNDTTTPAPAPTTTVAEAEVTIPGTPRATTTIPVSLGPGAARLTGTVIGPGGPVDGAVVRVERFVGQSKASVDVKTAAGNWSLDSVLGGAYRVQAFRPPDLGQGQPQIFFLGASETKQVSLSLLRLGNNSLTATVDPNPPVVGTSTLLTVTSADVNVDPNGQVASVGRAGVRMQLVVSSGLLLETSATTITDGSGNAAWRFRCLAPGAFSASLLVNEAGSTLSLPACAGP